MIIHQDFLNTIHDDSTVPTFDEDCVRVHMSKQEPQVIVCNTVDGTIY